MSAIDELAELGVHCSPDLKKPIVSYKILFNREELDAMQTALLKARRGLCYMRSRLDSETITAALEAVTAAKKTRLFECCLSAEAAEAVLHCLKKTGNNGKAAKSVVQFLGNLD